MKKSKKLLTILLVFLLALSLLTLVACTPPADPDEDQTDATTDDGTLNGQLLVKNGTFYSASNSDNTNAWLKDTVTGWTKNSGATSYSSSTVDVKMGVVDLDEDKFTSNKGLFSNDLSYPGISPNTKAGEDGAQYADTNAMVVALPQTAGSLYYRLSSAVTLTKNKYYKLSIDVWTQLFDKTDDLQGAYIYVTTGAYVEFTAIDTNAQAWKTYDIYLEANNYENRTIYIELWLGHGPNYLGTTTDANRNPRLTQGVAFFDNVLLEEIEDSDYKTVENAVGAETEGVYANHETAVRSLYFPDPNFTYESKYTSTSSVSSTTKSYYSTRSGSPNNYTLTVGKEDVEDTADFPTYTGSSATAGIFDMSKFYTESTTTDADTGETKTIYADRFHDQITSSFNAPDHDNFYAEANEAYLNSLRETEALLVYHPNYTISGAGYKSSTALLIERDKYYRISVWVYVWVPKYSVEPPKFVAEPEEALGEEPADDASDAEKEAYETLKEQWDKRNDYLEELNDWHREAEEYNAYGGWVDVNAEQLGQEDYEPDFQQIGGGTAYAKFKLSGVSVDNDNMVQQSAGLDSWQQLTFRIRGNELSDRQVYLEFWFGEGNWGEDTLMAGGAIFDNVSIEVFEETPDDYSEYGYEVVSPLTEDELNEYNLLGYTVPDDFEEIIRSEAKDDTDDLPWVYRFEDKKAASANAFAGILSGEAADLESGSARFDAIPDLAGLTQPGTLKATWPVEGGEKTPFNVITLYNKEYSAVTLTSNTIHTIAANQFYHLSVWVRTEGIDSGKGMTIALLNADDDTSLSTFSTVNTEGGDSQWREYSFYLRGSATKSVSAYLKFTLGTGDVFTPDGHVKGAAFITAITFKKIEYKEFNQISSDTYNNTYTVSSSSSTNTVTNGRFLNLDTSNYESDDEIFDEDGRLIGFAKPASWTSTEATGALDRPTSVRITTDGGADTKSLTWQPVEGAHQYYIYMDNVELPDKEEKQNDVLVGIVNALGDNATTFPITFRASGNFKVKAVRWYDADGNEELNEENWNPDTNRNFVVSPTSTTVANTVTGSNTPQLPENLEAMEAKDLKTESKMGIIDYKDISDANLELLGLNRDDIYNAPEGVADSDFYYISPNNNLLALYSNYNTRMGYVMSSTQSLSANSWYELGVWVKTTPGTKASVTIANSSNIFARTSYENEDYAVDGDYIGYVNIDTEGEWVFFKFYLRTTVNSASVKLELFLGNKYAVTGDDNVKGGMSRGTVLFDDVYYKSIGSEKAYNEMVYGSEDPTEDDIARVEEEERQGELASLYNEGKSFYGAYFKNQYRYKFLDYTVDSFDVTTSVTAEGQGQKPGDYSHYVANDGTDYSDDDDQKAMLYGVYDKRNISEDTFEMLSNSELNSDNWMGEYDVDGGFAEAMRSFMTTDYGNNFLMMANLTDNGQYYLSSTSISVNSESYYKITFRAKAWLPSDKYAEFRFEFGDSALTNQVVRIYGGDESAWKEYTLYIHNERTSAVSSNHISFYLGKNDDRREDGSPEDFFKGIVLIDQVSVEKLNNTDEYDDAMAAYEALSEDDQARAATRVHEIEQEETSGGSDDGGDGDDNGRSPVNAQLWLLIASIVIAVILIVVVVVITWRRIKKHIKRKPPKVRSVVPVNMEELASEEKKNGANGKKVDLTDDDIE